MKLFKKDLSPLSKIRERLISNTSLMLSVLAVIACVTLTVYAEGVKDDVSQGESTIYAVTYIDENNVEYKNSSFTLIYHGEERMCTASANMTLDEFLESEGISLGENDRLKVSCVSSIPVTHSIELERNAVISSVSVIKLDTATPVLPFVTVRIDEYVQEFTTEEEAIPFKTETRYNDKMYVGTSEVISEGKNGVCENTYKHSYKNGYEYSVDLVSSKTTVEPKNKIVEVGTRAPNGVINEKGSFVNEKGETINYVGYVDVVATAYGYVDGSHTCTGKLVDFGMIATDPSVIPLGTKCYVTGSYGDYGVQIAEDVGGAIKGRRIDIFLGDSYTVNRFGVRNMRVYIMA